MESDNDHARDDEHGSGTVSGDGATNRRIVWWPNVLSLRRRRETDVRQSILLCESFSEPHAQGVAAAARVSCEQLLVDESMELQAHAGLMCFPQKEMNHGC